MESRSALTKAKSRSSSREMKSPGTPVIAMGESFNMRPGGEEGVASSAMILPVVRQIGIAGWWERPADDHFVTLVLNLTYLRLNVRYSFSGFQSFWLHPCSLRFRWQAPLGRDTAQPQRLHLSASAPATPSAAPRGKMAIPEKRIRVADKNVFRSPDIRTENPDCREACVRKDLTIRLKHACAHLSSADFETLVSKLTHEQLRGEGIPGRRVGPS